MHFSKLFQYCPVCGAAEFQDNNFKSKKCSACGFELYVNASAAVAAFIVNDKNELLICVRKDDPAKGTWDLPGGFVDQGETVEEAIKREIKEEIGLTLISAKYLFSIPNEYEFSNFTIPTIDLFYEVKVADFIDITANDDVQSVLFVPVEQINPERFGLDSVKKSVSLYLEKRI